MSHEASKTTGNQPPSHEKPQPAENSHQPAISQGPARHYQQPQQKRGGEATNAAQNGGDSGDVPIGFRLVSGWLGVVGLFACYVGLMGLQASSAASRYAGSGSGSSLTLLALVSLAYGGGHLLAAYRTWTFHHAGWKLGVAMLGIGAGVGLLALLNGGSSMGLLVTCLYGGLAWHLYTNETQYQSLQREVGGAGQQPPTAETLQSPTPAPSQSPTSAESPPPTTAQTQSATTTSTQHPDP